MRYQLVLQWPFESSTLDHDKLVEIEDRLIKGLQKQAKVDGHDAGVDEANIFILTEDPRGSFERAEVILGKDECWSSVRAAYRPISSDTYTIIWPKELKSFRIS